MDLLLGDDETLPKNRLALICSQCKLVNGQAPPGVRSLEELDKWRCGGCAAWNGEELQVKKIVSEVREEVEAEREGLDDAEEESDSGREQDKNDEDDSELVPRNDSVKTEEVDDSEEEPLPKPRRGRPKGSGKKKG